MLPILSSETSSRDVDSSRRTRAQAAVSFDLVCPLVVHRASLALAQHWSARQKMIPFNSFIVEHCFHDVHGVKTLGGDYDIYTPKLNWKHIYLFLHINSPTLFNMGTESSTTTVLQSPRSNEPSQAPSEADNAPDQYRELCLKLTLLPIHL